MLYLERIFLCHEYFTFSSSTFVFGSSWHGIFGGKILYNRDTNPTQTEEVVTENVKKGEEIVREK